MLTAVAVAAVAANRARIRAYPPHTPTRVVIMFSMTSRTLSNTAQMTSARAPARRASARAAVVRVRAAQALWPDEEYIDFVASQFPEAGVATVEQARCLYDRGYDLLDIRSAAEMCVRARASRFFLCVN